jgi:hypothetical protein
VKFVTRRMSRVAGGAAAVCVAAALPLAWLSSSSESKTEAMTLSWRVSYQEHLGAPPATSSGDTLQATYTLTGATHGTADFACTAVGTHWICQGIIRLESGDIYAETGPIDGTQPAAVVGGTRKFAGVTGQFFQHELGNDAGNWTIELRE